MTQYPIIPYPQLLEEKIGFFHCKSLKIAVPNKKSTQTNSLKKILRDCLLFENELDIEIQIAYNNESFPSKENRIVIIYDRVPENDSPESYTINISEKNVDIIAPRDTGVFYAFQTLFQLITYEKTTKVIRIPCCRIVDWPSFPIRGFMHDVGRNYISIDRLKQQMQIFARYKLNVFHWHLTDNPAFRIESRAFPELNDPKFHPKTRNPGKYYTYEEIHKFVEFCKSLHITVIPEIDVPGHSKYFKRAFKTRMSSQRGMRIIQIIFEEFLSEFSKEEFPYIHIGSDEIHILNPRQFILFITKIVQSAGREILMWNPGLKPSKNAILHNWGKSKNMIQRYIDSSPFYLNNMDLFSGILEIFNSQPCNVPSFEQSKGLALGSTLCLWPDVNVEEESTTEKYNFLYPAIITYAERIWHGSDYSRKYPETSLVEDSEWEKFSEFENRLILHRNNLSRLIFFPYIRQSDIRWKIIGPFKSNQLRCVSDPPNLEILEKKSIKIPTIQNIRTRGASLCLSKRNNPSPLIPGKKGITAYAFTSIFSEKDQNIHVWIGFETPIRSNREYRGIPKKGQWDPNGGQIWLNDIALDPPDWKNAGKFNHYHVPSWNWPHHEKPYTDEEFFWTRKPYKLALKQGWNKICVKMVKSYRRQNWTFTFAPLVSKGEKFREKNDLKFIAEM